MGERAAKTDALAKDPRRNPVAPRTADVVAQPRIGAILGHHDLLALQRTAGNAVVQRLIMAEGKDMAGQTVEPMAVNRGTGQYNHLKENANTGMNTGFWRTQSDPGLELHVHFNKNGNLVGGNGIAHHFKRGDKPKGSVSNQELSEKIFGSQAVKSWNKANYTIKS